MVLVAIALILMEEGGKTFHRFSPKSGLPTDLLHQILLVSLC